MNKVPEGQRFSQRGEPTDITDRARVRLRFLLVSIRDLLTSTLVEEKLGLKFSNWQHFFDTAQTRDVLDLVTVAYQFLSKLQSGRGIYAKQWLLTVQEIFSEENIHYRVDAKGGVHFHFDEEFARVTAAAIAILQTTRYANSLDAFNRALAALGESGPDGKGAIRATFAAIEGLFKLMFPGVTRLASGEVSRLKPIVEQVYSGERVAQKASTEMSQSLADWIDAAHEYRHEQGKPDTVAQPPLTLAVYLVSSGATHLRWLAELDAAVARG